MYDKTAFHNMGDPAGVIGTRTGEQAGTQMGIRYAACEGRGSKS